MAAGGGVDIERAEMELLGMQDATDHFLEQLAVHTKRVATATITKKPGDKFGVKFDGQLRIESVLADTAAQRAGVEAYVGWRVTHIDSKLVATLPQIQALVKDAAHTTLTLRQPHEVHVDPTADEEAAVKQLLAHLVQTKRAHSEQLECLIHWLEKYSSISDRLAAYRDELEAVQAARTAELAQLKKLKRNTEKSRLGTLSNFVNFTSGEG